MNDRIKELAEQADPHVYERFDAGDIQELLEKFAELIVKECAMIAYDADADHGDKILEAFDMPYIEE